MTIKISRSILLWLLLILVAGTIYGVLTDSSSFDIRHPFIVSILANLLSISLSVLLAILVIDRSRRREAARLWYLKVLTVRPKYFIDLNREMLAVYNTYSPWLGPEPEWFRPFIKGPSANYFSQAHEIIRRFDKQVGHKPNPSGNPSGFPILYLLFLLPCLPFFIAGKWAFERLGPLRRYVQRGHDQDWKIFLTRKKEDPPCIPEEVNYPANRCVIGAEILEELGDAANFEVKAACDVADVAYEGWQRSIRERVPLDNFAREIEKAQIYEYSLRNLMDSLADLAPIQEMEDFF